MLVLTEYELKYYEIQQFSLENPKLISYLFFTDDKWWGGGVVVCLIELN